MLPMNPRPEQKNRKTISRGRIAERQGGPPSDGYSRQAYDEKPSRKGEEQAAEKERTTKR